MSLVIEHLSKLFSMSSNTKAIQALASAATVSAAPAGADHSGMISLSHKSIADELGTAREVVSRKLKDWEKQSWVELHRGVLKVLNRESLGRLSR